MRLISDRLHDIYPSMYIPPPNLQKSYSWYYIDDLWGRRYVGGRWPTIVLDSGGGSIYFPLPRR